MVKRMTDNEKLSALIDGEMIDKSLLQAIANDEESLATWQHYHLIGDVLRGDAPASSDWNIADKVALALENEPAHSKVSTFASRQVTPVAELEEQPVVSKARRQLPSWFAQLGQVAIAASVSLAVIVGIQQYGGETVGAHDEQLPVLQTIPFAGSVEPVSLTRESVNRHNSSESSMQEQRRRINALLQDYELQLRLNSDNLNTHTHLAEPVVE